MRTVQHKIKHYFQPTNSTCGYAALATLLSFYGLSISPEELVNEVPQPKDEQGKICGSVTAQLVTWCQSNGLKAHMYAFDCQILDLSWKDMPEKQIVARLRKVRRLGNVRGIGRHWTRVYIDAYIEMLQAGARLSIQPHVTTKLLYELLAEGPVCVNVCSTTLNGAGRKRQVGLRKSVVDDVRGGVSNHSTVVYGSDKAGNFLMSDPWVGLRRVGAETLLCAITAAQIECDNQCFVLGK